MMPDIVRFVRARMTELSEEAKPGREQRIVEALRALEFATCSALDNQNVTAERLADHPLAAGLLPLAMVWEDHPDFDPDGWFPTMIARIRATQQ